MSGASVQLGQDGVDPGEVAEVASRQAHFARKTTRTTLPVIAAIKTGTDEG